MWRAQRAVCDAYGVVVNVVTSDRLNWCVWQWQLSLSHSRYLLSVTHMLGKEATDASMLVTLAHQGVWLFHQIVPF